MTQEQKLSEAALTRETLKRLSEPKSMLHRAAEVLDRVAHNSVGLGEVLQDYAHQAGGQLRGVLRAGANLAAEKLQPEDTEALENIHFILKAVKSVLEMTPAAMQRNKADALGDKHPFTRADIAAITHDFLHSSDIARLLAEDAGRLFSDAAIKNNNKTDAPVSNADHVGASARH